MEVIFSQTVKRPLLSEAIEGILVTVKIGKNIATKKMGEFDRNDFLCLDDQQWETLRKFFLGQATCPERIFTKFQGDDSLGMSKRIPELLRKIIKKN